MAARRKVAVVGLDCGTPRLLFDDFVGDMPNLAKLTARSLWGPLRSTMPPITVPAWSSMFSGRTPGELGIYGFRNRSDHSYRQMSIATSRDVRVPRLWDRVSARGQRSVLVSVPGTYPPPRIHGSVVGDFLAPSSGVPDFTSPRELGDELRSVAGEYALDIEDFRTHQKDRVAQQLFDLTEQRFTVARHLAA